MEQYTCFIKLLSDRDVIREYHNVTIGNVYKVIVDHEDGWVVFRDDKGVIVSVDSPSYEVVDAPINYIKG